MLMFKKSNALTIEWFHKNPKQAINGENDVSSKYYKLFSFDSNQI